MDAGDAMLVFVGLVLGARVVFQVGSCYTMPVQLAFVPALFVLPAGAGTAVRRRAPCWLPARSRLPRGGAIPRA